MSPVTIAARLHDAGPACPRAYVVPVGGGSPPEWRRGRSAAARERFAEDERKRAAGHGGRAFRCYCGARVPARVVRIEDGDLFRRCLRCGAGWWEMQSIPTMAGYVFQAKTGADELEPPTSGVGG